MNPTKEQLVKSLKEAYSLRRRMHVTNIGRLRNLLKIRPSEKLQDELNQQKELRKQCDKAWAHLNNLIIGKSQYDQGEYDRLVNQFKVS